MWTLHRDPDKQQLNTNSFKHFRNDKFTVAWACSAGMVANFLLTLSGTLSPCNFLKFTFIGLVSSKVTESESPSSSMLQSFEYKKFLHLLQGVFPKQKNLSKCLSYISGFQAPPHVDWFCLLITVPCKVMVARPEDSIPRVFSPAQSRIAPSPHCSS